jgi:hypothetical protein
MILLLLSALGAHAATGLVWNWPADQAVVYHMETMIEAPRGQVWSAENNTVARSTRALIRLEVACTADAAGKSGWTVNCSLNSVKFSGQPFAGDKEKLNKIMAANEAHLSGKSVRFKMGSDGRVKKFDIIGLDTRNSRLATVYEQIRWMLRRAFTPLDLKLPKKGDDRGKKWGQKGSPMVFELMSGQGTAGGVALKHKVAKEEGGAIRIVTDGRAAIADGATMEAGTSSLLRVHAKGAAQFNTEWGVLDWAQIGTESDYSSSNLQGLSHLRPAQFSTILSRVTADGTKLEPVP